MACPKCKRLTELVNELIGTLEDLLQADNDFIARGFNLLPPLYKRGLEATISDMQDNLAEIEGLEDEPGKPDTSGG